MHIASVRTFFRIAFIVASSAYASALFAQRDQSMKPPQIDGVSASIAIPEEPLPIVTAALPTAHASQTANVGALGTNGLSMVGNVSYQVSGSQVTLSVDRVENTSSTRTSGSLRLELWMSPYGYRQDGYPTAVYYFNPSQLQPNTYFYNISRTVPYTAPPANGCYYVSMQLEEYNGGTYYIVDYSDFPNRVYCPNPNCSWSLSSSSASIGSGGGTGNVTVTGSPSGCSGSWSANANNSWLSILSGSSGSGSGSTTVTFSASPTAASRTGTLTIAGQTFTVSQSGPSATCAYTLTPASASFNSSGGGNTVSIGGGPAGCRGNWSASSTASWIALTGGSSGSGAGQFTLSYTVSPNYGSQSRSGSITIAGQAFSVTQSGVNTGYCTPDTTTACLLNNRFKAVVRYRAAFDNAPADATAFVKSVTSFAASDYETVFFYFNNPNNIEILLKMLDQGNTDASGHRTIAVLFGSATPLRVELTITDMTNGAVHKYTSNYGSQQGATDFSAFRK